MEPVTAIILTTLALAVTCGGGSGERTTHTTNITTKCPPIPTSSQGKRGKR